MSKEKQKPKKAPDIQIERIYEQPPDSISFYCEITQVFGTKNEIIVQLYETIPGIPSPARKLGKVRTRLKTTVVFSLSHAANLGKALVKRTKEQKK